MARKKYNFEVIINNVIEKKMDLFTTDYNVMKYLREMGLTKGECIKVINESEKRIKELNDISQFSHLEKAIGQMATILEQAIVEQNWRLALDVRKEMSRIQGHYIEKIEIKTEEKIVINVITTDVPKLIPVYATPPLLTEDKTVPAETVRVPVKSIKSIKKTITKDGI